jgi:hypothetical protein
MRLDDLLDLDEFPDDPRHPRRYFDERPCQWLGDKLGPIPMKPGKVYTDDDHYDRHGTGCLFLAVEPLTGFRFAQVRKRRTKVDYAAFMKTLVEQFFADVEGISLVQDNLNTQSAGSFYQAFDPETARQLKQQFDDP